MVWNVPLPTNKKSAHRFLLVQEDCPRALSVCDSMVRLVRLSSWECVRLYDSAAGQSWVIDMLQRTIGDVKFFLVLETTGQTCDNACARIETAVTEQPWSVRE